MARKRKSAEVVEDRNLSEGTMAWDEMMKQAAALGGARRTRKRFVGVRQRPSGRWVAEIKDTIQKIRVWGTEMDMECKSSNVTQTSSNDSNSGVEREEDSEEEGSQGTDLCVQDTNLDVPDFRFLDTVAPPSYYSPFEIAEEMEEPVEPENYGDEPSMLRAVMKRMKYERKFSASLYAFNGIPECLKLKLESGGRGMADHLTNLQTACSKNKLEKNKEEKEYMVAMNGKEEENHQTSIDMDSSSSSSIDGELLLWNSLDLPPICFVNLLENGSFN
ncbi:AP2/ERF domain [Sesbania bispinosa]|nr:AP2/ERF domain [Sesbania bispinosa]